MSEHAGLELFKRYAEQFMGSSIISGCLAADLRSSRPNRQHIRQGRVCTLVLGYHPMLKSCNLKLVAKAVLDKHTETVENIFGDKFPIEIAWHKSSPHLIHHLRTLGRKPARQPEGW